MAASAARTTSTSYVHVRTLSEGGMGVVELAMREEGKFRRLYAIKRLQPSFRNDDEFRSMFLDEARIAGLIRHPNVVSVLDVGEDERGPYLVMDFVDGIPLSTLIAQRPGGERIPVQIAVRIALHAALGLHAAHELRDHDGRPLGLVHRDVSPQNMLLGFDGTLRVTDFGIAKALGRSTRTHTGVLKGKLGYMSPEQLKFLEPDRRTDLFALGVVLYELLAGERLYRNVDGNDGVRKILYEPPPDIADVRTDVPPEIVELLFALLAKDPEARPQSAAEVARTLEEALAELIALEGGLEVGPYLEATYPGLREERHDQLERNLETAVTRPDPVLALGDPTSTTRIRRRARTSAARTWAIAAATGLVFAAGAWFLARATASPEPEAEEVQTASPPAAVEPDAEPASAAAPEEPPAGVDPPEDLGAGESAPPATEEETEAEPARPVRRRARRRRPRPRRPEANEPAQTDEGVRTFGWDDR